jgi:hypothetical protein
MAAILKLRRGSNTDLSSITLQISELFYNTSKNTLQLGDGSSTITLVKLDDINTGSLYLSGDLTASNARLSGDIVIGGNIYLGDSLANDNISIQASLSGSLIPSASNEYDLGSTSKYWHNAYITSASILDITLPASNIVSGSSQIDHNLTTNYTASRHIDHSAVTITAGNGLSGGGTIDATRTINLDTTTAYFKSGVKTKLNQETVISQSAQVEIDDVTGFTAYSSSVDSRLDTIEGPFSTSVDSRLDLLENFSSSEYITDSSSFDTRLDTLEGSFSTSVDSRLDALEIDSASLDSRYEPIASGTNTLISGSTQLDGTTLGSTSEIVASGSFSGSFVGDGSGITGVTAADVEFADILNKPALVSESLQIDHDTTTNFVANEHIDHSAVSMSAGDGISGGGDLTESRTITLNTGSNHFRDGVKTKLNIEGVISGSTQITNGSGLLSSSNENFAGFSSSLQLRLHSLEVPFSSSVDSRLDLLEATGSNHETRLDTLEGTFSQSVDSRLDTLEGPFSTSVDSRLDTLEGTFSQSIDQQLDSIHTYTSSLKNSIDVSGQNLTVYGNLTVQGTQTSLNTTELLVEDKLLAIASGSTTGPQADGAGIFISGANASMLYDSTAGNIVFNQEVSSSIGFRGDGSNLDNVTATSVDFSNITNKPTLVSGSDQVSGSVYTGVTGDVTITSAGISSISSNVIVNDDINVSAAIYHTKLNLGGSNIVTGSDQVSGSIYDGLNGDISSSTDGVTTIGAGVVNNDKIANDAAILYTKLDLGGSNIVSGSDQISSSLFTDVVGDIGISSNGIATLTSEIIDNDDISPSAAIKHTKLDLNDSDIVSSSQQIADYNRFLEINADSVVSGSDQVTQSLDLRYLEINGDSVVSSSAQTIVHLYGTNIVSSSNQVGIITNGTGIVSQSGQIDGSLIQSNSIQLPDGNSVNLNGSITLGNITNGTNIVSGSDQVTGSLDLRYLPINGFNVVSSSNQVTQSLNLLYEPKANGSNTLISQSAFSSPNQGRISIQINGASEIIDLGLDTIDSPTFASASLTNLPSAGAGVNNALFVDGTDSNIIKQKALGTAAYINVSASVGDDPNSIPTNQAVSNALIAAGAGDITAINDTTLYPSTNTGIKHTGQGTDVAGEYGQQGNVVIEIDTGSAHFTGGIKTKLNLEGVFSSSAQLSADFLDTLGDGVVSSSAQTIDHLKGSGILSSSFENFTEFSSSVASTFAGLSTDYNDLQNVPVGIVSQSQQVADFNRFLEINGDGVISGSVQITNGSGIVSQSQQVADFNRFLEINGDGVVSGSNQINDLIVGTSFSSSIDSRVVNLEDASNENPLTFNDTSTINLDRTGDTITATAIGGIISSSNQLTSSFDTRYLNTLTDGIISQSDQVDITLTTNYTTFSSSLDSRLDTLEGETHENPLTFNDTSTIKITRTTDTITADAIGGILSSSQQIADYNRFLEFNGDSVVSSSQQIADYNRFLEFNGDSVVSSSAQTIVHLYGTNIVSSSEQLFSGLGLDARYLNHNGDSVVSSSQQIADYNRFLEFNGDSVVSSSQQIDDLGFLKVGGDNVVSSSNQIKNLGFVDLTSTQTISGTKTFNDIVVNGTGSFAYIESVSGTAKIIGDAYIILNNDTPTERFAGIAVYDSGSAGVTASLEFDGQTNDWFYEYSDDDGVTTDHGVVMFGPEYSGKGSPTYNTNNTVLKSNGGHHTLDSNITDTGTLITLGSAVDVSGATNFNNTTQSTSKTTGAVIIDGGVGIAKTLNVGEDIVAYASSDERLKDNIQPIETPLETLNKIGGYTFDWNEEKQDIYKGKDYGVIAQEIEAVMPELVDTRDNGYKAVKYDKIVPILIESIKELRREIEELKKSK